MQHTTSARSSSPWGTSPKRKFCLSPSLSSSLSSSSPISSSSTNHFGSGGQDRTNNNISSCESNPLKSFLSHILAQLAEHIVSSSKEERSKSTTQEKYHHNSSCQTRKSGLVLPKIVHDNARRLSTNSSHSLNNISSHTSSTSSLTHYDSDAPLMIPTAPRFSGSPSLINAIRKGVSRWDTGSHNDQMDCSPKTESHLRHLSKRTPDFQNIPTIMPRKVIGKVERGGLPAVVSLFYSTRTEETESHGECSGNNKCTPQGRHDRYPCSSRASAACFRRPQDHQEATKSRGDITEQQSSSYYCM